jgi:preprotein translocase subunit SecB
MTDAAPGGFPEGLQAPPMAGIRVFTQFIRDLSFENPRAPDALQPAPGAPVQPQIEMNVELNARGRQDGLFEVDLKLSAAATRDGAPVFQLELVYGGLFQVAGVPEADLEQVLLIECPRFLFPFARRIVADLTTDGGFPPLLLEPMDFAAIYMARKGEMNLPNGFIGNA